MKVDAYINDRDYEYNIREINRQNRVAIRYLALAGIPVSLVNIFAQVIVKNIAIFQFQSFILPVYFILLNLLDRFVIPWECEYATRLVYLLEAPVFIVSILLGTIWDPVNSANTILMFMVVMPVFILDKPHRVLSYLLSWTLWFVLLCYLIKNPDTFMPDLVHIVEFFLAACVVTSVVLRLRFEVISGYSTARYHEEHDSLTGIRNRQSLEAKMSAYLGKPVIIVLGDLDQLTLFNDFYGHELGNEMLCTFADILKKLFGEEHTYRYGGDEVVCIAFGDDVDACLAHISACRKKLEETGLAEKTRGITCSFGYVTGTASGEEDFRKMLQLAAINVHKAGKLGSGHTMGCAYNDEALRKGMVDANLQTYNHSYEINQLSGLPAMTHFIKHGEEILSTIVDTNRISVVGFVNLKRFRDFNDKFGYAQGDELIRYTGECLQEAFPDRLVASITGGRFCFLCYNEEVEPGLKLLKNKLDNYKNGYQILIKTGFAKCEPGEKLISVLDNAVMAHDSIYNHKNVDDRFFDDLLHEEIKFNQYIVTHLDQAISQGWLTVYYQPIIRTSTGQICSMEALSRWEDPTYGFLLPCQFINILEEQNLTYKLNLHVVRQVLKDFDKLRKKGIAQVPVSVNLSRRDFSECDMVKEITTLVQTSGNPASALRIEITETAFTENKQLILREVNRFRQAGFHVWLDDFGSEYSTLNLLQDVDFNLIKIDMEFLKDFSPTSRNRIIVAKTIEMCKELGITTLVEGVETLEQYAVLKELGSEKLQGFLFSRPYPLDKIMEIVLEGEMEMESFAIDSEEEAC